ncbi:MAG: S9 family peptidase [Bacteroidetes bacterium]|nr:MAG: S9 family peptidase [Bacteroidota bacterium]
MKKKLYFFVFLSLIFSNVINSNLSAQQKQNYKSLPEALGSSGKLRGSSGPASVNWLNGGTKYSYTEGNVIKSLEPATGKTEVIFDSKGRMFPDIKKEFAYESFQFSKDSKFLLFQTNFRPVWRNSGDSDYYVYDIAKNTLEPLAKNARTAELSPDGKTVAYERGGNLFAMDFDSKKEIQLTNDAKLQINNGRFGWAYEEEFGMAQAWHWSNNSQYIAYWQTDETQVPRFVMTDYSGRHPKYDTVPYPKVGDINPMVKIGVVSVNSGQKTWLNVPLEEGYIPRMYWTADNQVAVVHLNRKQNHLKLFFCNIQNGEPKLIMEEKSSAWIDVYDFPSVLHFFTFPESVKEFFWISEIDGFSHLYRYDYTGKLLGQITKGNFEVTQVVNIDVKKKMVYYVSTEVSPLERHLYSIGFDGKNKKQLTKTAGVHYINFSPNASFYIDRFSNTTTPTTVALWDTKGKKIQDLELNKATQEHLQKYVYFPRELVNFTTSDGQKLDAYIIKPLNFDANKKYPMILNIYGGPGHQSVYNEFGRDGWEQFLAQSGYVVVSVNNRGGGAYGAKFKEIVYEKLGEYESKDFAETAKYMASLGFVDKDKIAIRGHSYGGYMSSMTILRYPDTFKVALVGAPVTDWRLYDSIYTERYMGLLPENEAKYTASAVPTYAKNLKGKMFIAHSTMDENVHVQNTFQLVKALIDNGKDADLRIYPPGNHSVAYDRTSYFLLYGQYMDYLEKHLK